MPSSGTMVHNEALMVNPRDARSRRSLAGRARGARRLGPILLASILAWTGSPVGAASPLTVKIDGDRLSVAASGVSLAQILTEIARVSHIDIRLESAIEADVEKASSTVNLDRVPVEDGLRRLLQGRNMMLLYDKAGLVEVRVY